MSIGNRFLLNFAASWSGGGYKRLHAYADWFNQRGGAWFAIHPHCRHLLQEFPNNRYFPIARSHLTRLVNDWSYLRDIHGTTGSPDLYYSYGIPLYVPIGRINWFHLSNVLPLGTRGIPLSWADRCKFHLLGRRIRRGFALADIVSAESRSSLQLMPPLPHATLLVSVNGSDDELSAMRDLDAQSKDNVAVVSGTYQYKALEESWRVFSKLRSANPGLKLHIIGTEKHIPASLRRDPDVVVRGMLARAAVIDELRKCRIYLSTTHVENSYNAAAEGVFLADESYVSDIGPHRELLAGLPLECISLPGVTRPLLHVRRNELSGARLSSWDQVVTEMISAVRLRAFATDTTRRCAPGLQTWQPEATIPAQSVSGKYPPSTIRTGE